MFTHKLFDAINNYMLQTIMHHRQLCIEPKQLSTTGLKFRMSM